MQDFCVFERSILTRSITIDNIFKNTNQNYSLNANLISLFDIHILYCYSQNPLPNPTCNLPTICSIWMVRKVYLLEQILYKYFPLFERLRSFKVRKVTLFLGLCSMKIGVH